MRKKRTTSKKHRPVKKTVAKKSRHPRPRTPSLQVPLLKGDTDHPYIGARLFLSDIVDFSSLEHHEQVEAGLHLWAFLQTKWGQRFTETNGYRNGTGDGLLLACNSHLLSPWDFVQMARAFIEHMANHNPPYKVRVGLHVGTFTPLPGAGPDRNHIVGTGVNEVARVCPLGDEGDIVLSEQFVQMWKDAGHGDIARCVSPVLNEPAVEVFIKRGKTIGVRFCRLPGAVSAGWPDKVKGYLRVDELLKHYLQQIEEMLATTLGLRADGEKIAPRDIDVRVSVFSLERTKEGASLRSTPYRYDHVLRFDGPLGRTAYPVEMNLQGRDEGKGPVGRAYDGRCHLFHRFPAADDNNLEEYCAAVKERTGLDPAIASRFRRKARAFMAVPFTFTGGPRPDGILCVDCMHPLDHIEESELKLIAEQVGAEYELTLALLWRLRGQL